MNSYDTIKIMDKKCSLKIKIIIGIVSFIFFFGLLEIGLRIAGHLYWLKKFSSIEKTDIFVYENVSDAYTVLCVGDSFTFGESLPGHDTYPGQLTEKLRTVDTFRKFLFINGGKCEFNSRQTLKLLPQWIKTQNPDLIILLVGAANRFNPSWYNVNAGQGVLTPLVEMIRNLRVFKMIRIIVLNLRWKYLGKGFEGVISGQERALSYDVDAGGIQKLVFVDSQGNKFRSRGKQAKNYIKKMIKIKASKEGDPLSIIWFYYNNGDTQKALAIAQENLEKNSMIPDILCAMGYIYFRTGQHQEAERCYKRAFKNDPSSELALCHLAYFYRELGFLNAKNGKCDQAVEYFLKAISLDPARSHNYYMLAKTYDLQSKYDIATILALLEKMKEDYPRLEESEVLRRYLGLFKNKNNWEANIRQWLMDDLESIAELCQEQNVKLIIQNYPIPYPMANNALKKIAEKYNLPFVDNCSVFHALISQEKRDIYLLDDDHCTVEGYRVMAENIYKRLISEGIVNQ